MTDLRARRGLVAIGSTFLGVLCATPAGCAADMQIGFIADAGADPAPAPFAPVPEAPDGSAILDETLCPSFECPAGYGTCGGSYKCGVDLRASAEHCGACGNACDTEMPASYHARWACEGGACKMLCASNLYGGPTNEYADCNGAVEDGCETYIAGCDPTNCGGCGITCKEGEHCALGICQSCPAGSARCDDTCHLSREQFCKPLATDAENCSACGRNCGDVLRDEGVVFQSGQTAMCRAGACVADCWPGFADCNGVPDDGCEAWVGNDIKNCGACGVECAPGETCNNGACCSGAACFCEAGQTACPSTDGSVRCVDVDSDVQNCGACGNECPGLEEPQWGVEAPPTHVKVTCVLGRCARDCELGFADCAGDGQCRDLRHDPYNCGACGQACEVGQPCIEGACATKPCGGGQ